MDTHDPIGIPPVTRKALSSRWAMPLLIAVPVIGIAVVLVVAAVLATNSDTEDDDTFDRPLVGMNVLDVQSYLPDSPSVVYDLSLPVAAVDASYDSGVPGRFTVITACGHTIADAPSRLVLGVIPTERMTAAVSAEAAAGGYDTLLSECS